MNRKLYDYLTVSMVDPDIDIRWDPKEKKAVVCQWIFPQELRANPYCDVIETIDCTEEEYKELVALCRL